jgi:adenylate kinase family enzyme
MKAFNHHITKSFKVANSGFPHSPKVVLFGSPNVDVKLFAHRIAIDLGVPAVSISQIYRTILAFQEQFAEDTFYRRVINILKSPNKDAALELESNQIPEKLLTLTKYTELGYVLYDYPNNVHQAKLLESHTNGGINLALNLMLKKDIAKDREDTKHQCMNCERYYYKANITHPLESVHIKGYFPEDGVCTDVSFISWIM